MCKTRVFILQLNSLRRLLVAALIASASFGLQVAEADSFSDLQKKANSGDLAAMTRLGDYRLAMQWYRKAADARVARAMINLGGMYQRGEGVTSDIQQARSWYEKAAALGDKSAKQWLSDNPK